MDDQLEVYRNLLYRISKLRCCIKNRIFHLLPKTKYNPPHKKYNLYDQNSITHYYKHFNILHHLTRLRSIQRNILISKLHCNREDLNHMKQIYIRVRKFHHSTNPKDNLQRSNIYLEKHSHLHHTSNLRYCTLNYSMNLLLISNNMIHYIY